MGKRGPGAERQRRAREEAEKRPKRQLPWNRKGLTLVQSVIKFLEFTPITKGRLCGKRFRLLPNEREFVENVFAADKRGRRKIALAILSEPKGNGKTDFIARILLAFLVGPLAEERGELYSASISRGKAAAIFDEMKAIVLRVPEFAARVNIVDFHKKMHVYVEGDGFDSTYEALSADASTAQGLAPTAWAYDELGEAKDGELLSVLMESEGKRDHTLGIVLSTQADDDDHPLSKLIDDAHSADDESMYLQLHCAPDVDDPFADATLKACNPAWGKFLDLGALKRARDRARRSKWYEPQYRRLRLNQRVAASTGETRLVNLAVWKEGARAVDRQALRGRPCFGGLDLSSKHDLTAFVLVFPSDEKEPSYDILPFFWTPKDQLKERQAGEQARFREWISAGHMRAINGPIIRMKTIAADLRKLASEFDIRAIGYDKWKIDDLKLDLADIELELPLHAFGQGHTKAMASAIEFFTDCALTGRLSHGGHPVLTASVANAITTPDSVGNPMINRPKSQRRGPVRVDGAVALVMALGTARHYVPTPQKPGVGDWLKRGPIMVGVE